MGFREAGDGSRRPPKSGTKLSCDMLFVVLWEIASSVPTTDRLMYRGSRIGGSLTVAVIPSAQKPDRPCHSLFPWLKSLMIEEKHNVPAAPEIQSSPRRSGTNTACCVGTASRGNLRVEGRGAETMWTMFCGRLGSADTRRSKQSVVQRF
jgi:hypothetical protein